jgi:hypothetical protein
MYGREGYRVDTVLKKTRKKGSVQEEEEIEVEAGEEYELKKLSELGFEDGTMVLAWDGLSIEGQRWDFNQITTSLSVKHFFWVNSSSGDDKPKTAHEETQRERGGGGEGGDDNDGSIQVNEFVIRVPEQWKLFELLHFLASRTGIPEQQLILFKVFFFFFLFCSLGSLTKSSYQSLFLCWILSAVGL